ncbi:MAG TPA: YkgJ family cysteine cluster protein [Myxococcota bacterium]|nr:YkgJ family cysteine cluster protein [Myxococcota bacterium]
MSKDRKTESPELPYALRDKRKLGEKEKFDFACHAGLACFTKCCSDINIMLTPLDVLGLARRLGVSTGDFLQEYTLTPITKDLHLPVVLLRMNDEEDKCCPLLGAEGCTVYAERPWACRMYPLGMALPPARAGQKPEPVYLLFEDDFCEGTRQDGSWSVDEWRENQGVVEREELESGFTDIVSHPWFIGGRQLDVKRMDMFYTACYDLDAFRRFIFDSSFLERFELEQFLIDKLRTSDEELLRFSFRWLRFALFAEPTMQVREDAPM